MADKEQEIEDLRQRLAALESGPVAAATTPLTKKKGRLGCIGALAIGFVTVAILVAIGSNNGQPTNPATVSLAAGEEGVAPAPPVSHEPAWTYSELSDAMVDKKGRQACTTSTNMARLDFPYRSVTAELCVREQAKTGLDIYVALNGDGQILCTSYQGCTVHVRFDQKPMRNNSAVGAADNSSNIVFLRGEKALLAQLRSTAVTRVELQFYQAGLQTLEFRTKDLKWDSTQPK